MRHPAWLVFIAVGTAAGVLLRVGLLRSSLGSFDGDEAVWGLMSAHVLDGEPSAFFWGQAYGGTLEALLTAPLVAVAGLHVVTVRLVPMLLSALAAVLVWRVGRRTIGEPAALAAGVLFWVWPPYLLWKTARAHGFYSSSLVLVLLALLLVLRLAERRSRLDSALLGAVLGLSWWQSPQTFVVAVPALAWLTWRRPRAWRDAWIAIPCLLLAASPWFVSNMRHDWWSLTASSGETPYVDRLRAFFAATLPMDVGLRVPFTSDWLGGNVLSPAVYAALIGLGSILAWRHRRENLVLLVVVAAAYPFLHALSPFTWITDEPRYVLLLTPALVLLLAWPLTSLTRAWAALAVAVMMSTTVLALIARSPEFDRRADGLFVPSDLGPLVTALEARGLERVYADYWVASRITFATDERIVAAQADVPTVKRRPEGVLPDPPLTYRESRYPKYDLLVRAQRRPPYVVLRESADYGPLRKVLLGAGYRVHRIGRFDLFVHGGAGS